MASSNKYSTLTQFPCNFSFLPASLAFLCGCQHTHTFLGQRNDYSKANKKKKKKRRGGWGCLTEETGRQGPVYREIGSSCVLKAGDSFFFVLSFLGGGAMLK